MNPKKLEERVAKLERELAFVKAQGLSKDEQAVLLNEESAPFFKMHSNKLIWAFIFGQLFFMLYLLFKLDQNSNQMKNTAQGIENQDIESTDPKRDQPFLLP